MKQLPRSILALLVVFAFFFNIERIDFDSNNVINIASAVYVLATVACLLTISWSFLSRLSWISLLLFWQSIYVATEWFLIHRGYTANLVYIYVTEATFLSLIVLLSKAIASHLADFVEAVENITFPGSQRLRKEMSQSVAEIQNEMYLSRRYDRPLSVIVMETEKNASTILSNRAVQEIQKTMMNRYIGSSIVRILDAQLRRTDMLVHYGNGRFVIVCPETDENKLESLIARIRVSMQEQLGLQLLCGAASFPDGALTFDELLMKAESRLSASPFDMSSTVVMNSEGNVAVQGNSP